MLSRVFLCSLATFLAALPLGAQEQRLRVAIFDCPPLAMKDDDGQWIGLSVDLWERIAEKTQIKFDYVEVPLDKIFTALTRNEVDIAIGDVALSGEREQVVDFTQTYLENTAAAVLLRNARYPALKELFSELTDHGLFNILGIMFGALVVFSGVLWVIERRAHQGHFGGRPIHGIGSAIWFSAVTMTTVGYGDKTPQTPLGRFLAFIWMFFGILLVSAFTGTVASSLTIARLSQVVDRPSDLARFTSGVVDGSVAQSVLKGTGLATVPFPTVEAGLKALADKQITAFVGDNVSLRYLVTQDYADQMVVDKFPSTQVRIAVAARAGLPQFQQINVALIDVINSDEWETMTTRWTGPPPSEY